jgi:hypothetical protein
MVLKSIVKSMVLSGAVVVAVGCGHPAPPTEQPALAQLAPGDTLYTLTNLHYDAPRRVLYSQNYQLFDLIPMCTRVVVGKVSTGTIVFTVVSTRAEYDYELRGKSTPEGFRANFARYFGPSCAGAAVAGMSEVDQQGIHQGRVLIGMTKQGVIYAIGYPPRSQTKSTDLDKWRYWHSRFTTFVVFFQDGKVTGIKG